MVLPFDPNRVAGPRTPGATATAGPLTVSQVTALIKRAVETTLPPTLTVIGQISNCKRHTSGHLYFTLKDAFCEIAAVMRRSDAVRLKFQPGDGLEVIANGSVEVFERAGRYQLYVRKLEPRGVGALELAYRQLCEKLRTEGLFEPARKKPLPRFPQRIAIVTSPTGAAIADMLRTIRRRFPCVHVLVHPVRVQGPGAAREIAAAITGLNAQSDRLGGIDLIIVGRGGGSLEDLWAFNEEAVARAVFASRIPIISGVGHEVDTTICDLVADVRTPTPTAAAELAVPELADVLVGVGGMGRRLLRSLSGRVSFARGRVEALAHRRPFREPTTPIRHRTQAIDELTHRMHRLSIARIALARPRIDRCERVVQRIAPHSYLLRTAIRLRDAAHRLSWTMNCRLNVLDRNARMATERLLHAPGAVQLPRAHQRLDQIARSIPALIQHRLTLRKGKLEALESLLGAVSHQSVLSRGYSITRLKKGRQIIRSVKDVTDRQRIVTELADGQIESETVDLKQLELFE